MAVREVAPGTARSSQPTTGPPAARQYVHQVALVLAAGLGRCRARSVLPTAAGAGSAKPSHRAELQCAGRQSDGSHESAQGCGNLPRRERRPLARCALRLLLQSLDSRLLARELLLQRVDPRQRLHRHFVALRPVGHAGRVSPPQLRGGVHRDFLRVSYLRTLGMVVK